MAKEAILKREDFLHLGSVITYLDNGEERCLGNLMHFEDHGVYDPYFGKVDITPEEAEAHNKALDQALIDGLDHCEIDQHGFFYHTDTQIRTFTGLIVSNEVERRGNKGNVIIFRRNGKVFRGIASKDADCFTFRRIE